MKIKIMDFLKTMRDDDIHKRLKRFFMLCIALQIIVIFLVNSYLNSYWTATKNMTADEFSICWQALSKFHISIAFTALIGSIKFFWSMQATIFYKSFTVWVLMPMVLVWIFLFDERQELRREEIRKQEEERLMYQKTMEQNRLIELQRQAEEIQEVKKKKKIPKRFRTDQE